MNAGVSIVPCCVRSDARRALELVSVAETKKGKAIRAIYSAARARISYRAGSGTVSS